MKNYLLASIALNIALSFILFNLSKTLTNNKNKDTAAKSTQCPSSLSEKRKRHVFKNIVQKLEKEIKPEDHCFRCPDLNTFFLAHGIKQISSDEFEAMITEHHESSEPIYTDSKTEAFEYDQNEVFNTAIEVGEQMLYSETKEEALNKMIKLQFLTNILSDEDKREIKEHLKTNE